MYNLIHLNLLIDFVDKTSEKNGTPINRNAMMAIQGFESLTTEIKSDGSIVQTNDEGQTLTTTVVEDGSIVQVFAGEKTITKTISVIEGKIVEVIS